jgi:hypothetical protein
MSQKVKTVQLNLYRLGKSGKLVYDGNGKVASEKDSLKISHGTIEWKNFKKQLIRNGYGHFEVLKVTEIEKRDENNRPVHKDVTSKMKSVIESEIKEILEPVKKVDKTGDSEELKELRKQNEMLQKLLAEKEESKKEDDKPSKPQKAKYKEQVKEDDSDKVDSEDKGSELEDLRAEFKELYGAEPDGRLGIDKLKEAIEKKK